MFDELKRNRRHNHWFSTRPALLGLTAGIGLGAVVTALITKRTINRRLSAIPRPLRWAVKELAKSLR